MCIYTTVVCTECQATCELQSLCRALYPLVPSNMATHAVEVHASPIAGLCSTCTSLLSLCDLNFAEQPAIAARELPFEVFDEEPLSESPENAESAREEKSEAVELPFGPFDEELPEDETLAASLSWMDLAE